MRKRILGHDVLDRIGTGREIALVFGVEAVLDSPEHEQCAPEVIGVSGTQRKSKLVVPWETSCGCSLVQKHRLECLNVVAALVLHAIEPRNN